MSQRGYFKCGCRLGLWGNQVECPLRWNWSCPPSPLFEVGGWPPCAAASQERMISSESNVKPSSFQPGVRTSYNTMTTLGLKHGSVQPKQVAEFQHSCVCTAFWDVPYAHCTLIILLGCVLCTLHTKHSFGLLVTKQNLLSSLSPQPLHHSVYFR